MNALKKIKVAVKDEKVVLRDPRTGIRLTTEGTIVRKTAFWIRRLKAGDCIELPLGEDKETKTEVKQETSIEERAEL